MLKQTPLAQPEKKKKKKREAEKLFHQIESISFFVNWTKLE